MSQLKGLALPLAMRLTERLVCRLLSAGPLEVLESVQNPIPGPTDVFCVHA